MSIWQMVTWDVARAGGFTAFGFLALSVAIGLALTLHIQSPRWPRVINSELHNFVTLLALVFTRVTLVSSTGQQLYTGSLTNLNGDKQWHMTTLLTGTGTNSGSQLQAQIDVQFNANGQAAGTIKAGSAVSAGGGIEH